MNTSMYMTQAQCDKINPENCSKNHSSRCAYDCAQLQYTINTEQF